MMQFNQYSNVPPRNNPGQGNGRRGSRKRNPHFVQHAPSTAESKLLDNLSSETKDPATKASRIFVGNLDRYKVYRKDLYNLFQHYGTITAISNLTCKSPKGGCCFAFIQFIDVDSAHNAVEAVNGRKYHGYALEVRLAEFKGSSNATPIRPLMATDQVVAPAQKVVPVNFEPVFKKRPFSGARASSPPQAKKSKSDTETIKDILVCGSCHGVFNSLETLIDHKRTPCRSQVNCRCQEESIPEVIACSICLKQYVTPWQLIQHVEKCHHLTICKEATEVDKNGLVVNQDVDASSIQTEDCFEEYSLDLDNDLLEEDDSEGEGHQESQVASL